MRASNVKPGRPLPLGVRVDDAGANFSLFSRHATRVWLEFYSSPDAGTPKRVIDLKPSRHRTGDIWHVWVAGIRPGTIYAYRVDGPNQPDQGHRYDALKLLLDPYATAITRRDDWDFAQRASATRSSNAAAMPKCVVTGTDFDWEGDQPLRLPWSDVVIYETHVRGFTRHGNSSVDHPGTYRGLIEKLPYLRDLGITAIELMPVHEFNQNEVTRANPETGERLSNYWGYDTVGFFAPKASYAATANQVGGFKELVKACHSAGIEVILDVVFNHTAEGNEHGPTLSFRGIDNVIYYLLGSDKRTYENYTGTGNTINANHPVVRDFILDALRYWTLEMHIDGFRFDLASVLDRDENGDLLPDAPLLERIAEDPILCEVRIIAEAWDAAGAYQVGSFSEARWAEWNGRYRDDVRRFWRGDAGMVGEFASRICGSSDIYAGSGKGPESSINFVTAHDGFTLNDLVSYERKHNEANGEDNRDGSDQNYSANYGVEGDTDNTDVESVRLRQIKNFILTLFISRGVPMLLGGDEFRRTQGGNNNAYCQDNATSWHDWRLLDENRDLHRFVHDMIAFRRSHPVLSTEAFYDDTQIMFFDDTGASPDWDDPDLNHLGVHILGDEPLVMLFNPSSNRVSFALPTDRTWALVVDTTGQGAQGGDAYTLGPRASAILEETSE